MNLIKLDNTENQIYNTEHIVSIEKATKENKEVYKVYFSNKYVVTVDPSNVSEEFKQYISKLG